MNIAFISLGCAKNLVNTEQMMALCRQAGWEVTTDPVGADVAVLNTCGFIDSAKSEAIDQILYLAHLKEEGKLGKLLVAGCLSQRYQFEMLDELPEIDGLLGTGSYTDVVEAVKAVLDGDTPTFFGDIHRTVEDGPREVSRPLYSAYLKIAEGCDNHCAYCVIPSLRGRYRSRTMDSLLAEARSLADQGVGELIVVAQDITRYGTDQDGKRHLSQLLNELCKLPFHWIRLHYLYPDEIDRELIDTIASQPKIVKYLDIPIQHLSDRILKSMNRRGSAALIRDVISDIRNAIPDVVLRTSIIVGFPGETEEDFEELCRGLPDYGFQRAGVFQFSAQEDTPAYDMPDQVPQEVARHRADLLVDLQSRVMDRWNEARLGTVMEVLCEGFDQQMGCFRGRSYADSPDVDGHVFFTAAGSVPAGSFVQVLITGTSEGDLTGEMEGSSCESAQ